MKAFAKIVAALFLSVPLSLAAQTITVGSTTTQLNTSQRGSVATYWPDGNMGAIYHSGTNYVFAPTANPGVVQVTIPSLSTWSSGLSVVNPSTNIALGGTGAFDNNYTGGGSVYYDSGSGYLVQLYHGEYWFGGGGAPFYSALGLAYSTDFGVTWHKLGEVISPQSLRVNGGTNCQAEVGNGTLLVVGSYFYAYYTDMPSGCSSYPQIAVARASISSVIAAAVAGTPFTSGAGTLFMKYTGSGTWTGNGVNDLANPQNGGGAFSTVATDGAGNGQYEPNVRYDSVSNTYIMVYATITGINAQTSTDGLSWGNQQTIKSGGGGFGSSTQYYYPTLFNTGGGDPQLLGTNFSVFYVYPFNPPGGWPNSSVYSTALSIPGGGGCGSSSPYTAASANESDVNSCINGPGHTAVNGDTIQIPCSGSQAVTWSSTLTVAANITLTALGATPNSGPSTFGAGTNCLTITAATSTLIQLTPTYSPTSNVTTIQNMTLVPGSGAYTPIRVNGTGSSSGMPQVRIDNIQFGNGSAQWQYGTGSNTGEFTIIVDNAIGVADHNTLYSGSHAAFISTNLSSYLGVGSWGDNSWAQPDTMGGANNFFVENNQLALQYWSILENEQTYPAIGGGRTVVRFNKGTANGIFFLVGGHGLETDGRPRSDRHKEVYGNQFQCTGAGQTCYNLFSARGGTGIVFGNAQTVDGSGALWSQPFALAAYRFDGDGWASTGFGSCGNATSGNAHGPFDGNDGVQYYSGTFTSGTSGVSLVASGSPGWTTNQWAGTQPYSVWDVTQGWVSVVLSNGSNTLTVSQAPHGYINGGTAINAASGDSFQIRRSTWCTDGPARGQGVLLSGNPAVVNSTGLVGPSNEALDPVYEWDDSFPSLQYAAQANTTYYSLAQPNREYYTDNSLGVPAAGTTYSSSVGVNFGPLANRPSASGLAAGSGYFATDQGSWNSSSNTYVGGYTQGIMYISNGSTWSTGYTPYGYPHPLAGGGAGPPIVATPTFSGVQPGVYSTAQSVALAVGTPSAVICFTTDGSTPTAPTPGTCSGGTTRTYTGPITTVGPTNTEIINAIATLSGYTNSSQASGTFVITALPYVLQTNNSSASTTLTFSGLRGGDVLYLGVGDSSGSNHAITLSDTQGNTWNIAASANLATNGDTLIIAAANVSSGSDTITAKVGGVPIAMYWVGYEVLNGTTTLNLSPVSSNTLAATSCNSGPLTTSSANTFLFGLCGVAVNQSMSVGSGWSNGVTANGSHGTPFLLGESQVGSSTTSYTATSATLGTSSEQTTILAAFLPIGNYTYSTAVSPSAGGSLVCTPTPGTYAAGQTINCTATANAGYTFNGFTGLLMGTTNPNSFKLNASGTVTANFYQPCAANTVCAASCSQNDVQTAFNNVVPSTTTVIIPSGTPSACSWTSTVSLTVPSGNAGLTVQGQTVCTGAGRTNNLACTDNTSIADNMPNVSGNPDNPVLAITTLSGAPFTLQGLTITGTGNSPVQTNNGAITIYGGSTSVRLTQMHTVNMNQVTFSLGNGTAGVFDHSILAQATPSIIFRTQAAVGSDTGGNIPWSQPTNLGTANQWDFEDDQLVGGYVDCDKGGRFVARYNTFTAVTGTAQWLVTHFTGEPGGALRGCRAWEAYNNTFNIPSGIGVSTLWILSSGTGVNWGNVVNPVSGAGVNNFFSFTSGRSSNAPYTQTATPNGWGYCGTNFCQANPTNSGCPNGASTPSSVWDQNTNTATGYRCMDNPGTGKGDLLTVGGNFPTIVDTATGTQTWPHQASEPIYEWLDTYPSGNWVNMVSSPGIIVQNSDFYLWCNPSSTTGCTSFNGTVGVGSGLLSARPATCTTGVAYWATDQGNWNKSGSGTQGQLSVCTATNTWTTSYTPLNYPNPLVSAGTTYSLLTTTAGTGTGTITGCAGPYPAGGSYSCTITPSAGSSISGVTGCGGSLSGSTYAGNMPSQSCTVTATFQATAVTPSFSPVGGSYSGPQSVTISTTTSSATIYYTTDGSTPTTSSTVYSGPINVNTSQTLKAIAVVSGYSNSAVGSAAYTISTPVCANPTPTSPTPGSYTSPPTVLPISIGFNSSTPGCSMHMTLDSSTPNCSSAAYSSQMVSVTTTMKVIACQAGYTSSAVQTGTWTITVIPPPPPIVIQGTVVYQGNIEQQ